MRRFQVYIRQCAFVPWTHAGTFDKASTAWEGMMMARKAGFQTRVSSPTSVEVDHDVLAVQQ